MVILIAIPNRKPFTVSVFNIFPDGSVFSKKIIELFIENFL